MIKEYRLRKEGHGWFRFGYSFKHFSLGIRFDKNSFDLDLCFFWIGLEW